MESRMHRADPTAPTTPEQYRAAMDRQERVIADLRKRLEAAPKAPFKHRSDKDAVEQSFQHWLSRHSAPLMYKNLFREAHSAGYWDGQESVAPDYEPVPLVEPKRPFEVKGGHDEDMVIIWSDGRALLLPHDDDSYWITTLRGVAGALL